VEDLSSYWITLRKGEAIGWEDGVEDVSSYSMTLRKREAVGNWKRKH
jgi:hypothetical protein